MKNKNKIIAMSVIFVILIIIGLKYFPVNFRQEMFGFEESYEEKFNSEENGSKKYIELEDVELDYNFAQMVEDKCYIETNSNAVYHIKELENFLKNVDNKKEDEIRIVQYTIEGQPILTNLEYKDNKFILKIDSRRDGWSAEEDRKITTTEYDVSKYQLVKSNTPNKITERKTCYEINLQNIESGEKIFICNYVEIKHDENQKFEILFNKGVNEAEVTKILGREETDKYDYDIYSYKGTAYILINGEKMSLRDALLNNKITVEEILEKADKDSEKDKIIYGAVYRDGGSKVYIYDDYSILKFNTLSEGKGSRDLYIGVPSMNINELNKQ